MGASNHVGEGIPERTAGSNGCPTLVGTRAGGIIEVKAGGGAHRVEAFLLHRRRVARLTPARTAAVACLRSIASCRTPLSVTSSLPAAGIWLRKVDSLRR